MGVTYQTLLATGDLAAVRAAVAASGQQAVIMPVGAGRWAVVPRPHDGYAATDELARLLSAGDGAVAATFEVVDSALLVAGLFRGGRSYHDYLDDQSCTETDSEEDVLVDGLGRTYPIGAPVPTGAYGADPRAFAPLAVGPLDEAALGAVLRSQDGPADQRQHEILRLLGVDPGPVLMAYEQALDSGLGVTADMSPQG